ncbi:MAG: shikimate dehydrogenase [Oligosphaeraceae bacterium]|nr:shikimate dehydrogenase [Oligosphaeraceae bacterium]
MSQAQQRYGVIGWPVAHSCSPLMQEAAFRAVGINATYELLPVAPENLAQAIPRLLAQGYKGWNVTVPHKEAMLSLLQYPDKEAALIGSVNTVLVKNQQLYGYSTDGYGLQAALWYNFNLPLAGSRVFFLGCGGAARAAACHFAMHQTAEIVLSNRTKTKALTLAADLARLAPDCKVRVLPLDDETGIAKTLPEMQLLLQCTSLGLRDKDPLPLNPDLVPHNLPVFDMIYAETAFQKLLKKQGKQAVPGWDMLIYQGCRSFEIWTGQTAPEMAMRQALQQSGKMKC